APLSRSTRCAADQPALRVSGCDVDCAGCTDWASIVFAGSIFPGSTLAVSSSDMPFLKALMPVAKSPISSEIFPRPPNSSRTTTATRSQCTQLKEPIGLTLRTVGLRGAHPAFGFHPQIRLRTRQKQGLQPDRSHPRRAVGW